MWHFFHSQQVVVLAVGHSFGQDSGHFSGLERHAIPYKEDYVLSLARCLVLNHGITGLAYLAAGVIRSRSLYRIASHL